MFCFLNWLISQCSDLRPQVTLKQHEGCAYTSVEFLADILYIQLFQHWQLVLMYFFQSCVLHLLLMIWSPPIGNCTDRVTALPSTCIEYTVAILSFPLLVTLIPQPSPTLISLSVAPTLLLQVQMYTCGTKPHLLHRLESILHSLISISIHQIEVRYFLWFI